MSTTRDTFRRENWRGGGGGSFLIERDFFFFLAKLLFEKFLQVPERRCDPDCNLFECHLRFSLQRAFKLVTSRAVGFSSTTIFLWKIFEKNREYDSSSSRVI